MKHTQRMHAVARLTIALAMLLSLILPAGLALAQQDAEASAVQWSGVIDSVGDEQWVVAGQAVAILPTTIIRVTGELQPGMWADVQAMRDGDTLTARRITANPAEMHLRGQVSAIPENGIGAWIIGGQPFEVTADTIISDRGGPVVVGAWVQVTAVQDGATLLAQRIRAIDPLPAVEVMGAMQAFTAGSSITISGINLAIDDSTLLSSEPRVGLLASAAAQVQDDASLLALRIRVLWQEHGGPQPPVTLTGTVQQMPPNGVVGQWVVNGVNVVVSRNTLINQSNGVAVVGAVVRVIGQQVDATVVAREIIVISSPVSGDPVRFEGRITALPSGGLLGNWTIAGRTVQVTENTRLQGEQFARIGAVAQVWGLRQPTGEVVATNLVVHPWRPGEVSVDSGSDTATE